ncbi:hypothetical protein GOO45_004375 [Salmonella enterica]|nr:hypothetical protein [Salmonella enterica]EDS3272474.1 hypothetical protein [Salmonella enterica subsp. enterica serovar Tallahassee]EDS8899826.1 hypothetical protein [Salmonella enterica subsp. enterica serovar Tallahassee]EDT7629505.1 hypothetical protein [Salmonella enterica subsp. enterica serovar Tallahassee]EDU5942781.1 hypothetical protein [Salmonella enterica]
MVGAQKGALQRVVFIFSLFFIVLHDDLSPAFAPKAYKWTSTEVFFISKINKLPTFLG